MSELMPVERVVERFRESGIKISERTLRNFARRTGHYRKCGRALFFTSVDFESLLLAMSAEPVEDSVVVSDARIASPMTKTQITEFADRLDPQKPRKTE